MKKLLTILLAGITVFSITACSSGESTKSNNFKDGTYTGRSSDFEEDETGNGSGYGEVELVIKDNKITDCTFKMYELDGTLKDETYGANMSKENRLKAQKAVQSADKYAASLVEAGNIDDVDGITGATISYNEFKEAVNDALDKARE